METKDRLLFRLFGEKYGEFFFIDTLLESFGDGYPRTDLPTATGEIGFAVERATKYLLDHNLIEPFGNGYVITAMGRIHLANGGCSKDFLYKKLQGVTMILSIISTLVSIAAFFIALYS